MLTSVNYCCVDIDIQKRGLDGLTAASMDYRQLAAMVS